MRGDGVVADAVFRGFRKQTVVEEDAVGRGDVGGRACVEFRFRISALDAFRNGGFERDEFPVFLRFRIGGIRPFGERAFGFAEEIPAADRGGVLRDFRRGVFDAFQQFGGDLLLRGIFNEQRVAFPASGDEIPLNFAQDFDIASVFVFAGMGNAADGAFHAEAVRELSQPFIVDDESGAGAVADFAVAVENVAVDLHWEERVDVGVHEHVFMFVRVVEETHDAEPLDFIAFLSADGVIGFHDENAARKAVQRKIDTRFALRVGGEAEGLLKLHRIEEVADFDRNRSFGIRSGDDIQMRVDRFAVFDEVVGRGGAERAFRKRNFIRSRFCPLFQLNAVDVAGRIRGGAGREYDGERGGAFPCVSQRVAFPFAGERNFDGRPL